jgi:hypothetical protein
MIRKLLAAVASLCLSLTPTMTMAAQEVERSKMSKAHQQVYDASLALYGELGQVGHFLCTTTVIAARPGQYLLLTAGHCVVGEDLPTDLKFYVSEQIVDQPIIGNPNLMPVEVVRAENDDKYDFALLQLTTNKNFPVIGLSDKVPQVEDKVYTVNFSLGVAKQVALGEVATGVIGNEGSEGDCGPCKGRYLVHLFAGPGASGSAIIDEKTNEIVGVGEIGFPGQTLGLGCETIAAFREWLKQPVSAVSAPKA